MKVKSLMGVFTLTGILLATSCSTKDEQNAAGNEKVKVQVATVNAQDVEQLGTFTASVEAETTNNIAPQMSARIKKVYVEVGDYVSKGQKLADMDAMNLNQTRLQMENDKTEFNRVDELYKVGGISRSSWDAKKLAYELSKESYENLLENTSLRSPISGIVTKRNYDSGDMYGMGEPLYVVEQIRPVKLMVHVSEALFNQVKKGMEVAVTFDVHGEEVFTGTVSLVHPSIDPGTRTFPVEIKIKNTDERIRPGMFARVTFNYGTTNRVMVPDAAVMKQTGSADRFVYTCTDNSTVNYQKVILGRLIGDRYEVISGLDDGETVVTTGQNRLNNGTEIEIVNK